jgi:nucleoside-diphosphate-sugar epimerase
LSESLQVDIGGTKQTLGWTPPVSVDDALRSTADSYLRSKRQGKHDDS